MKTILRLIAIATVLLVYLDARAGQAPGDQIERLLDLSQNEAGRVRSLEALQKVTAAELEDPYRNIYTGEIVSEIPILITKYDIKSLKKFDDYAFSNWLEIKPDDDFVTAELHLFLASYPKVRWMIEMQLLDVQGEVISEDVQFFENAGVRKSATIVSREKISLHFQKSADMEAVRYRLAINTFWGKEIKRLQVDKERPGELTLDAPKVSALRYSIDRSMFKETNAKVHASYENWPATTWTLTLNLLDDQKEIIASTNETFSNGGIIISRQSLSPLEIDLHFDNPLDLSKVSHCEFILKRTDPKRYLEGTEKKAGNIR